MALARQGWGDAIWSFLYKHDTRYGPEDADAQLVAEANRRMRGSAAGEPRGPFIKPPVWTWEVPLYFWVGGAASGSAFVAFGCDIAGDHRSARIAREVSLALVMPAPLLLIADLGRPGRFLNMLRVFKPRSPMNLGAWCLVVFSAANAGAVGADRFGFERAARALGAITTLLGGYLGSYTGVLLAATAVPLWARSHLFLGPIFVATATATGAAATRLTLAARGLPERHPTHDALSRIELAAMLAELGMSNFNERRLGPAARSLLEGPPGRLYASAKWLVRIGLAMRMAPRRLRAAPHVTSVLFLAAGLTFRYAWVEAGKASAADDEGVALAARRGMTAESIPPRPSRGRLPTAQRPALAGGLSRLARTWTETVRRTSLLAEGLILRRPR